MSDTMQLPEPSDLFELASTEEARVPLGPYSDVIVLLRDDKHFSFRAIVDWLNEQGVPTNQSAVYRMYTKAKGMNEHEAEKDGEVEDPFED